MGDPAIGWIAAIIIGGIAGWLAEQFMKSITTVRLIVEQISWLLSSPSLKVVVVSENAWVIGIFSKRVTEKTWSKV